MAVSRAAVSGRLAAAADRLLAYHRRAVHPVRFPLSSFRSLSAPSAAPPFARWLGVVLVLAVHVLALWALLAYRLIPLPTETVTLMVNFIAPPAPQAVAPRPSVAPPEPKPPAPKPRPPVPSPQLLAEATPSEPLASAPAPVSTPEPVAPAVTPAAPLALPVGPVALGGELAVVCPQRRAPAYPAQSRRLGETGKVILRVTLDERGKVAKAMLERSSGYPRLDEAALGAVREWQCTPARRNGQPVEATALQPFNFVLEGY